MHRRERLAGRLAVCQILGTLFGIALGTTLSQIWSPPSTYLFGGPLQDFAIVLLYGLGFGIPFYCVAILILQTATNSILKHPAIWCIGIPASLLAAALFAFPPAKMGGISWITLIPLSALFAGSIFYGWLRHSPLPVQ
jgi:hypothetical protein